MIQKICNPVQCNGGFPTSCGSLNDQNFVLYIPNDLILFFLDSTDNILQLYIPVTSKLLFQDLIINLGVTFKCINHLPFLDLILPFGSNLPFNGSSRCFIRSLSSVIIIKKTAHWRPPAVDQWRHSCLRRKIADSDVKTFAFFFPLKEKIHSSEIWGVDHFLKALFFHQTFIVRINFSEKCLLIIIIFITILIHLRIVFPIIIMHALNLFFSFKKQCVDLGNACLQFLFNLFQKPNLTVHCVVITHIQTLS